MENEIVLGEHHVHQNNGGFTIKVIAVVDKHTQYLDGVPIDGFSPVLKVEYSLMGIQTTSSLIVLNDLDDVFGIANALSGAGYKLREAVEKAQGGRDK